MASKIKKATGQGMACTSGQDKKIAELAYLKAERRGFVPGYELDDWLEAEQEVSFTKNDDSRVVTGNYGFQVEA